MEFNSVGSPFNVLVRHIWVLGLLPIPEVRPTYDELKDGYMYQEAEEQCEESGFHDIFAQYIGNILLNLSSYQLLYLNFRSL